MGENTSPDEHWQAVDREVNAGIAAGAFPGAVLLAGQGSLVLFHRAYGMADIFSRRAMTRDTVFDLASLTKPLGTTLAAMHLVDKGVLDLEVPVADVMPGCFSPGAPRFTSRMLLTHTAGLAAWRPYFRFLSKATPTARWQLLWEMLLREPLVYQPGTMTLYSDVGFMMLARALEALSGESLPDVLEKRIYPKMEARTLFYRFPEGAGDRRYAAGQLCPWRRRLLVGVVDDENAFSMGGADGHAGLFGTAPAVHRVVTSLWRCFGGDSHHPAFSPETVRAFLTPPESGDRALGFDVPSGAEPACGHFFKTPTIGHLGFTGVSFWLELATGIHIVLLTNRTHPYRFTEGIKAFRPAIHDAVMSAIKNAPRCISQTCS